MDKRDLLTVSEVSLRSGLAASALRFYEKQGLITASRTSGGQRRFERSVLRRLAFIRAARNIGVGLDSVRAELDRLPAGRPPTKADWNRISISWRGRLDEQIAALHELRDTLTSCIGCGCLSLRACAMSNPEDEAALRAEVGAANFPPLLRRTPSND